VDILIPGFLIVAGVAAGLVFARRFGEIPPGLPARLAVSVVYVGVSLTLITIASAWIGFLALGLGALGALLPRAFIAQARETRWHWPSVMLGFVFVPFAVAAVWLASTL
jgi:hypothetical protein